MSLSDIVSALRHTAPTEIALLLFLTTFFVVVGRLMLPSQRRQLQAAAMLPLEEAPVVEGGDRIVRGASHVKS